MPNLHTMKEGDNRLGPNHHNIIGRKAGSLPDYDQVFHKLDISMAPSGAETLALGWFAGDEAIAIVSEYRCVAAQGIWVHWGWLREAVTGTGGARSPEPNKINVFSMVLP